MTYVTLIEQKLQPNYKELDTLFKEHNMEWAADVKLLFENKLLHHCLYKQLIAAKSNQVISYISGSTSAPIP